MSGRSTPARAKVGLFVLPKFVNCGVLVALSVFFSPTLQCLTGGQNELNRLGLNWDAWIDMYSDTWLEMLFSFLKHQEHLVSVLVKAPRQARKKKKTKTNENKMVKGYINGLWLFYTCSCNLFLELCGLLTATYLSLCIGKSFNLC